MPKPHGDIFLIHFYDRGLNDKGIGIQLGYSIGRVIAWFIGDDCRDSLGYLIGMSPVLGSALMPFIQLLKPISPLAWMPIALPSRIQTLQYLCDFYLLDLAMLTNTAFGVANVRREWRNVARTLELSPMQTATKIVIPAAAPTIVTGMRISMGIAWLVIVAAEMLVGGTGIG